MKLLNGKEIDINERDYEILVTILKEYPYEFYAYGSRVKGYARKFSDLDIFYVDNLAKDLAYELKDKLEESNISIKVSLLNKKYMSDSFYNSIVNDFVRIV